MVEDWCVHRQPIHRQSFVSILSLVANSAIWTAGLFAYCNLHLEPRLTRWWLQQLDDSCCPQLNHQRMPQEQQLRKFAWHACPDKTVPGKLISEKHVKFLPLSMCLQSGSVAGPGTFRSVLANLRGKVSAVPRGSSPLLSMEESSVGFTICNGACSDFRWTRRWAILSMDRMEHVNRQPIHG